MASYRVFRWKPAYHQIHLTGVVSKKKQLMGHAAVRPTMTDLMASRDRANRAGTEFLKCDLETAMTFVKIAQDAADNPRRAHNCRTARRAYETVIRLVSKVKLNTEDAVAISAKLKRLKTELEGLGETF